MPAPPSDREDAETWEVERWLLRQGMSLMARNTRRFGVLGRALPVLVGFVFWQLAGECVVGVFRLLPRYRDLPRADALDLMVGTDDTFSIVWLGATTVAAAVAIVAVLDLDLETAPSEPTSRAPAPSET